MFVKFTTEKGVSAKVRAAMKSQVLSMFKGKVSGLEDNANGGFSIYLADDSTNGKPIYAHFTCVINQTDPSVKASKSKKKSTKKTSDEPMPNLFAEDEGEDEDEV
jgi:hypothetical protein